MILDVGCGTQPKGDVNIDFFRSGFNPQTGGQVEGEFMSPSKIENFVVADAMHLPFKDKSFNVVFSSHTIEHVQNPLLMLREMCRVAKKKIVVRCPHRKGSGAIMPYHINYFDEDWFKNASNSLGVKNRGFIFSFDYPITPKFKKIFPSTLYPFLEKSLPWRALKHFERRTIRKIFHIPFELEVWMRKEYHLTNSGAVKFIVICNKPTTFNRYFASSPYISQNNVIVVHNTRNKPLPKLYNKIIKENQEEDVWFIFCHQDFILKEDLQLRLKGKGVEAVYGPIGARYGQNKLFGRIIQANGTFIGCELMDDAPVQTLDEMCLIVNSEVFRQGLSFDERFRFHFYGADLCMQANQMGFDVLAMQLRCQHKSRTLTGDITSQEHLESLKAFTEKWKRHLPIKTTTRVIEK